MRRSTLRVIARRAGFTLVELILAVGLLSILVIALVRLLDTSLTIWDRTEVSRELNEMGSGVFDLFVSDLGNIEGGPRGDLIGEWVSYDTDGDGTKGLQFPRIRLIRRISPAELLRLEPEQALDPLARDLVEVCWALIPRRGADPQERSLGVLWRGQRLLADEETLSFFDERFFNAAQKPPPGSLFEVTGGVLWFSIQYAAQTSVVRDGWTLGGGLADVGASWDAWSKGRPDLDQSFYNEAPAGMAEPDGLPILPRRIRIEMELERTAEIKRRTSLFGLVNAEENVIRVRDERRLPKAGSFILVGEEWMQITSVSGSSVTVLRGQRGTRPALHADGATVHHGWSIVREIPLGLTREDWNL